MSGITNWSEALANPCFWAAHYTAHLSDKDDLVESFFDYKDSQCKEFLLCLYGDDDFAMPLPPDTEYEYIPVSVLELSFPENFTWTLEFGGDGLAHQIYHPQIYPEGLLIAEEGGSPFLPGLRWAELKQMVACSLLPEWFEAFDPQTLYPLLYTIVDPVTKAEYDEVRQTLRTAWETLQVGKLSQLEQWLNASISVYEKGQQLSYDVVQGWYEPVVQPIHPKVILAPRTLNEENLWLPDRAGDWFCNDQHSLRRYGSHDTFAPFFEMLERYAQSES